MTLGLLIAVIIVLIVLTSDKRRRQEMPKQTATVSVVEQVPTPAMTEGFSPESGVNYGGVAKDNQNWAESIQDLSLDPSIKQSHKRFVTEIQKVSNGAEKKPELDHMININSWVGLRRPDFTRVKEGKEARFVSSIDFNNDSLVKPKETREWHF